MSDVAGGDQGKEEGDRSVHERTVEWKPTSQQFVLSEKLRRTLEGTKRKFSKGCAKVRTPPGLGRDKNRANVARSCRRSRIRHTVGKPKAAESGVKNQDWGEESAYAR